LSGKKRRRMTLPKKKDDLEKVVKEVQESHAHDHGHGHEHHHHHHHVEIDELLYALDLQLEAMNQRIRVLEDRVRRQQLEIATIYRVLARLVEAIVAGDEEAKKEALARALAALEGAGLSEK